MTLELGGKNPAIVDGTGDVDVVARRLRVGEVPQRRPDVRGPRLRPRRPAGTKGPLLEAMAQTLSRFYGDDPRPSPDLARVVNDAHMDRLVRLLESTRGRVVAGGTWDGADRYLAPTVVADVGWDDPLMQEEISVPSCPWSAYDDIDEALAEVNRRDKPLALYMYSGDAELIERGHSRDIFGLGLREPQRRPAGGARAYPSAASGPAGMGAYHGRAGFDTFSHTKSVLRRPQHGELPLMYPPYTRFKRGLLRKVAVASPMRARRAPAVLESGLHNRGTVRMPQEQPNQPAKAARSGRHGALPTADPLGRLVALSGVPAEHGPPLPPPWPAARARADPPGPLRCTPSSPPACVAAHP